MSLGRLGEVFRVELSFSVRRPLFWMLVLCLGFFAFLLPTGDATISSGNAAVGGTKAWITSEFANAQLIAMLVTILYAFFVSIGAGMTVIRDEELKVGEVLHATPLTAREYVWGKFLAQFATILAVLLIHLTLIVLFNHAVPRPASEIIGPFVLSNYVRPALAFAVPTLLFFAGVAFLFGVWTRLAVVVFVAPVAAVLFCGFFLWEWSPSWLTPGWNQVLSMIDPAGVRWLTETWLKVDRGVDFYNKGHIGFDAPFLASRAAFALVGLLCVVIAERRFAARGRVRPERVRAKKATAVPVVAASRAVPLRGLSMRSGAPGLLAGAFEIARVELRELRSTPGLYLFVPVILIQTLGGRIVGLGAFDTPLLNTPGMMAGALLNTLTVCLALLLLFYTVESLERERRTGLNPIAYASPVRTPSLLLGKVIANAVVAAVVVGAALLGCIAILLIQGKVAFDPRPFLLVWGLLLFITLVLWLGFVGCVYAVTKNRFTTYGVALAALSVTGWFQFRNKMNWVGNWDLWDVARWTDMGVFELDRPALVLNRIMAIGLAVLFIVLTVRLFPRREADATRLVHRLRPAALGRSALVIMPLAIVPAAAAMALWMQVQNGFQGDVIRKRSLDYWKQNVATWSDADLPAVSAVDLDLQLDPPHRSFRIAGSYRVVNPLDHPLRQIPLTAGMAWDSTSWTVNGRADSVENRSRLYIVTPPRPLAPGDSLTIGFRARGHCPAGVSKNGGRIDQFILPSGVVLTGFDEPTFVPMLGFQTKMLQGLEEKDRPEPRVLPDDYFEGRNRSFLAIGDRWFSTRMRVSVPQGYMVNATGVKVSEETRDGRTVSQWVSDHPVRLFNVVAARWAVKRGNGAEIYYYPKHPYNVDEMLGALVAARRWYSEWFAPYPWSTLRLSEFPFLATYAQGSPTNITFSEGIGFLTKSEPKANAAFWITAHEAAHQWWGNILMPADGPGNEILGEGMSHYSTILLTEQVQGLRQRLAFCRQIEDHYGDTRRADGERSLLRVDGARTGDETVIYDKAGMVFWMLQQLIGRDAMLAGLRELIATYRDNDDHATVPDALSIWRRHAPDPAAYDAFVQQWFHEVVVPEYKLRNGRRTRDGADWLVHVQVRNDGSGRMPVTVAATHGERFESDGKASAQYRDARVVTVLGKGESHDLTIRCGFEPDEVVVDPDYQVLQLERKHAQVKL